MALRDAHVETMLEEADVTAVRLAAEGAAEATHLPVPPVGVGLIAFGALVALLAITWAFRSVGNRH